MVKLVRSNLGTSFPLFHDMNIVVIYGPAGPADVVPHLHGGGGAEQRQDEGRAPRARGAQVEGGQGPRLGQPPGPAMAQGRRPCHLCSGTTVSTSAANRLISEVVQSRRMPLLGPSPG